MNIRNIEAIMESEVWKRITKNKGYRGNIILDTYNKPHKQRELGQMFVLLIFFSKKVRKSTIESYRKDCCRVPKRSGESLDTPPIHDFYGTMQMLRIS